MYNIVDSPGYFGGNKAKVYSRHATLAMAKRAARRYCYTDERGERRCPVAVVRGDHQKGDHYWGDMYPEIVG